MMSCIIFLSVTKWLKKKAVFLIPSINNKGREKRLIQKLFLRVYAGGYTNVSIR